jgi:hypothetical protein
MKAIVLAAAVLVCAGAAHAQAPVSDYFSLDSRFDGANLAPGTIIEAWDADGIRCGQAEVNLDGGFLIHVNGNDTLTPAVDEGANPGEFLTWRIAGTAIDDNNATWIANIVGAFNDIRWENGAAKQIRLEAHTTAIEVQTWTGVKDLYRP